MNPSAVESRDLGLEITTLPQTPKVHYRQTGYISVHTTAPKIITRPFVSDQA